LSYFPKRYYALVSPLLVVAAVGRAQPFQGLTSNQLIDCLRVASACDQAEAIRELSFRKEAELLMAAFDKSSDWSQREKLVEVMSGMDEPSVAEFMRSIARPSSEREVFLANLYLARRGDQKALENLSRAGGNVPSYEWAAALSLFGKYKYRPAVDTLIDALEAASGNVTQAAEESLRELFPRAPVEFESSQQAQRYFRERARDGVIRPDH
jgi:hypothetical protein